MGTEDGPDGAPPARPSIQPDLVDSHSDGFYEGETREQQNLSEARGCFGTDDGAPRQGEVPRPHGGTPAAPFILREIRSNEDPPLRRGVETCGRPLRFHHPSVARTGAPPVVTACAETAKHVARTGYPAYSCQTEGGSAVDVDFGALANSDLILVLPGSGDTGESVAWHIASGALSLEQPPARVRVIRREAEKAGKSGESSRPENETLQALLDGADGEEWQGWADEVSCPHEAKLRWALLDYAQRAALLPGSQRVPLTALSNADFSEILPQAWQALGSFLTDSHQPVVYQRQGSPVFLQQERTADTSRMTIVRHTPDTIKRDTSKAIFWHGEQRSQLILEGGETPLAGRDLAPVISAVSETEPRPHACIVYVPPDASSRKGRKERWEVQYPEPRFPNTTVTRSMSAALPEDLELSPLDAVIDIPVLSRDGRCLLTQRGYYRGEGLFIDGQDWGECPPVYECVRRIDQLFGTYVENPLQRPGFPFDSQASRAHLFACLLARIIGPAVPLKPAFLFDKATPRTGASLMAATVALILTGDLPSFVSAPTDGRHSVSEMTKGLSAAASESNGVVLMDNATGLLNDPEWARYATSEVWQSRRLRTSDRNVRVSRRNLVDIITANNLMLTAESAGRVCISRLDAGMEDPTGRHFTFSPDNEARNHREYYVQAIAGLVLHWLGKGGRPQQSATGWAGYEQWRDITGGILEAAGIDGFGQSVGYSLQERIDDGGEKEFVRWWWKTHGSSVVGTREMSSPAVIGDDETGESGILLSLNGANSRARRTSLGSMLRTMVGRVYHLESGQSVSVKTAGTSSNRSLYRLEQVLWR